MMKTLQWLIVTYVTGFWKTDESHFRPAQLGLGGMGGAKSLHKDTVWMSRHDIQKYTSTQQAQTQLPCNSNRMKS